MPLSLIDDIIAVSTCSPKYVLTNATIHTGKNTRQTSGAWSQKCFQMHIGKSCESWPLLNIHGKEMSKVESVKYLGQIITSNGRLESDISERYNKGMGIGKVYEVFHV